MIATVHELNSMNLGTHMSVMEELNEDTEFDWEDATVVLQGYYTRVVQTDHFGTMYVCTYKTDGEGDLVSMRVYDCSGKKKLGNHTRGRYIISIDDKIGVEMWWSGRKEDAEDKT